MAAYFTPASVRAAARRLYADAPPFARFMATHRATIAPIADVLNAVPIGARVLDVGCGNGLLLNVLADARRIASVEGVDVSASAIAFAHRAAERLPASARPAFASRPPETLLPDAEFDAVLFVDVMHHVPPTVQDTFLRQVGQRVRPGGLLIYKDMCRQPRWRAAMNRLHDAVVARQWIHYYPAERIGPTLGDGFMLVHAEDRRMLWYGHEIRIYEKQT